MDDHQPLLTPDEATQQLIEAVTADLEAKLTYVVGDASKPVQPEATGPILIPHVCNDVQAWGAGFTRALENRFPGVGALFCEKPRKLGDLHVLEVGDNPKFKGDTVFLVNMVAQHSLVSVQNPHPLDYQALAECMKKVSAVATGLAGEPGVFPPTIHCPRFGSGLAGGDWNKIEAAILGIWVKAGIDVYVYDLPPRTRA
jgi:hypothetical protein